MNDKLELKDLVGYLPYGLKCQLPKHQVRYGQQEILELNGLSLNSDKTVNPEFLLTNDDLLFGTEIKWWKPILRPLSDLVNEIEVDGHRIVPIVEIAKFLDTDFQKMLEVRNKYGLCGIKYIGEHGDTYVMAYHTDLKSFGIHNDDEREMVFVPNQLNGFNKLHELHFDVFGLIKRGLAVDINTI